MHSPAHVPVYFPVPRRPPIHRKQKLVAGLTASKDRGEVTVEKTAVYADIVSLQKVLVPTYIFLPLWLTILLSMVRCDVV